MKIRKMPQAINGMDDPDDDIYTLRYRTALMFHTADRYRNLHGIYIHPLMGSVYWDNGSVHGYSTSQNGYVEIETITYYT